MPLCTTRFLQFLQQEQAWLHSKIKGGSILLNSCSSRPSWGAEGGQWCQCEAHLSCLGPTKTPQENSLLNPTQSR
jgi:hypothetical protein